MFLHMLAGALLLALLFLVFAPPRMARLIGILLDVSPALRVGVAVLIGFLILPFAALAQTAATGAQPAVAVGTIPLSPWVALLKPYLDMIVTALVGVLVTFAVAKLNQYFGTKVQATNVERIKSSIATDAAALVAAAADNLAGKSITVSSPVVERLANAAAQRLPDVVKAAGITPDRLKEFAAGEIGKLQAVGSAAALSPTK